MDKNASRAHAPTKNVLHWLPPRAAFLANRQLKTLMLAGLASLVPKSPMHLPTAKNMQLVVESAIQPQPQVAPVVFTVKMMEPAPNAPMMNETAPFQTAQKTV